MGAGIDLDVGVAVVARHGDPAAGPRREAERLAAPDLGDDAGDVFGILVVTYCIEWVLRWMYFHDWRGSLRPTLTGLIAAFWGMGFIHLIGLALDPLMLPMLPSPPPRTLKADTTVVAMKANSVKNMNAVVACASWHRFCWSAAGPMILLLFK